MCMGCMTSAEALFITGTGALGAARVGAGRLLDRVTGRAAGERQRRSYEHTAAFLTDLGHDPAAVLGAAPDIPVACVSEVSPAGHPALTQAPELERARSRDTNAPLGTRLAPA